MLMEKLRHKRLRKKAKKIKKQKWISVKVDSTEYNKFDLLLRKFSCFWINLLQIRERRIKMTKREILQRIFRTLFISKNHITPFAPKSSVVPVEKNVIASPVMVLKKIKHLLIRFC